MPLEAMRVAAVVLTAALAAGCTLFGHNRPAPAAVPTVTARPPQEPSAAASDLNMMHTLQTADPAQQAELYQSLKDAAELAPTTGNVLRWGLALATPGYSGSDPVAAQRHLSELLATPETLLPEERLLAEVELGEVDQRLILMAENKQLRDDASHDLREKLSLSSRRLAAETDENARLRKSLDEAQAKLEAVTHIERSINSHGANAPHTP